MVILFSGHCGRLQSRAKVILVGTHADKANCPKNARGEYVSPVASSIFAKVQQKFQHDLDIVERVFVMDAQVAMSTDIKALKHQLYNMRANLLRVKMMNINTPVICRHSTPTNGACITGIRTFHF